MQLHTIGIDLGKNLFHLVGLNQRGEVVVRKKFSANNCCTSREPAGETDWHGSLRRVSLSRAGPEREGYQVRLMPAQYVSRM